MQGAKEGFLCRCLLEFVDVNHSLERGVQQLDQVVLPVHRLAGRCSSNNSSAEQVRYHVVLAWGEVKLEIVLLKVIRPSLQSERSVSCTRGGHQGCKSLVICAKCKFLAI